MLPVIRTPSPVQKEATGVTDMEVMVVMADMAVIVVMVVTHTTRITNTQEDMALVVSLLLRNHIATTTGAITCIPPSMLDPPRHTLTSPTPGIWDQPHMDMVMLDPLDTFTVIPGVMLATSTSHSAMAVAITPPLVMDTITLATAYTMVTTDMDMVTVVTVVMADMADTMLVTGMVMVTEVTMLVMATIMETKSIRASTPTVMAPLTTISTHMRMAETVTTVAPRNNAKNIVSQ